MTRRYRLRHETAYAYSAPVFLEPQRLRFRLRSAAYLTVEAYALEIAPAPEGRRVSRDAENNVGELAWFSGPHEGLVLTAETVLSTSGYNPLGFVVEPAAFQRVPFDYPPTERALLAASLAPIVVSTALRDYAAAVLANAAHDTVGFLLGLAARVHADHRVVYRETGAPMVPDETFARGAGSCRDLSWMLIAVLRDLGIAARFTSGYFYFEQEGGGDAYDLHAWVEAFVPGAGWLGLDPSHGIATGNAHFPICSSAVPARTMTVSGGIWGEATATLRTHVAIVPL